MLGIKCDFDNNHNDFALRTVMTTNTLLDDLMKNTLWPISNMKSDVNFIAQTECTISI